MRAGVAEWFSHGFVNRRRRFDSDLRPQISPVGENGDLSERRVA